MSEAQCPFCFNELAPDPEREAMARVCEAAAGVDLAKENTSLHAYWLGTMRHALVDLERARKGAA